MRIVIQRVSEAHVTVAGEVTGKIGHGYMILVGVEENDTEKDADWLAQKIVNLRIFEDDEGKMNRSVMDVGGAVLCISQFTLIADYKKGNRPSFIKAARPEKAVPLFEHFKNQLAAAGLQVESGIFGADMKVSLVNDGPVTITMDSITKN